MALTLDQLGNLGLSAGQKAVIQAAINIGNSLRSNSAPDLGSLTAANAKKVGAFIRDINTLLSPAAEAARYIREKTKDDAAKVADDAVPEGSL